MRTALLAVLALLLTLAPAVRAGDTEDPPRDPVAKHLADLKEEIASLRRLHGATNTELRLLTERLERIERSLERLGGTTYGSRSLFTPTPTPPPTPFNGRLTGQLRLDNRMAITAYVTIDGITYTVPPLGTRVLRNQPAGMIGYALGGDGLPTGPERRTVLAAGERLTITVFPPE